MNQTTERLHLRPFTVDDITPEYIEALNDKEVVQYTDVRHSSWNADNSREFVLGSNIEGVRELVGIFLQESGKHIGNIRLHFDERERRVALAIMIWDKRQWNKGYGTETLIAVSDYVFDDLGYHKLWGGYYPENASANKLFEKVGFEIEGVLKDHFVFYGRFVDEIFVAKFNKSEGK